jgi:succinate dehydrogenase / fumarate reductase cytochrome b subunit
MLPRVHALLGIVPLGSYLVFHIYQTWPALADRELWVERAMSGPSRDLVLVWVLLPLALHALLGLVRLRRAPDSPLNGPKGLRAVQAATGVLALLFVVHHLMQVWSVAPGPHSSPRDVYALLMRELGRPLQASIYVIGVTALCFHLGLGLSRASVSFGLARSARAVRRARFAGGTAGFVLWVLLLQLLGHFAIGQRLIPLGG